MSYVTIHINHVSQISVDIFSEKHRSVGGWTLYFELTPSSIARLRRFYQNDRRRCVVYTEWSRARWLAYREWSVRLWRNVGPSSMLPFNLLIANKGPHAQI
jgi:hypothetical protein